MHPLLLAILFDLADLLPPMMMPIIGDVADVIAFLKKFFVAAPVELIPGIDLLPTYTAAAVSQRVLTGSWTWFEKK